MNVLPEIEPCNLVTKLTALVSLLYAIRGCLYSLNKFMVYGIS